MKEYRIVCTLDTEHYDGTKHHYDAVTPWLDGRKFVNHPYKTKSDAKRVCVFLRKKCKEFDKFTEQRYETDPINSIKYTQTNIRVQTREVTPWTDVE